MTASTNRSTSASFSGDVNAITWSLSLKELHPVLGGEVNKSIRPLSTLGGEGLEGVGGLGEFSEYV